MNVFGEEGFIGCHEKLQQHILQYVYKYHGWLLAAIPSDQLWAMLPQPVHDSFLPNFIVRVAQVELQDVTLGLASPTCVERGLSTCRKDGSAI